MHRVNPRDPVLEEAAIAKSAALELAQIDVRQDEARERKEKVDPKVTIRHQPKLTHSKPQMVLKMVQKHPKRRDKSKRSQWFKIVRIGE